MTCWNCGGQNTCYQPFSSGREYWCYDCKDSFFYRDELPPRLEMLAGGKFDELRREMQEYLDGNSS